MVHHQIFLKSSLSAVSLLLTGCISAYSGTSTDSTGTDAIRLDVHRTPETQKIWATMSVHNISDHPIELPSRPQLLIVVRAKGGGRVAFTEFGKAVKRTENSEWVQNNIPVNETRIIKVCLSQVFDLSVPGTYTARVELPIKGDWITTWWYSPYVEFNVEPLKE